MKDSVIILDPGQDSRWDEFVSTHSNGWICHLSAWKDVIENSFNHMKGYYLAIPSHSGEKILAGLPIFLVKSWLTGVRLVSIPFATISDPLFSDGEHLRLLLQKAIEIMKLHGASFIEVRSLQASSKINHDSFARCDLYKNHYLELNSTPDVIKAKVVDRCVRRSLDRAMRSEVVVRRGETEDDLASFFWLYKLTRRRLGLPCQPFAFFLALWRTFQRSGNLVLYSASRFGDPAAGLIVFRYGRRVSAEFLGTNDNYKGIAPNHLLYWTAIREAAEDGYEVFDFGRTSPSNYGLMDFKNRWGTKQADISHFFYPRESANRAGVEKTKGYLAVKMLFSKAPLICQELLGRIAYRHLG